MGYHVLTLHHITLHSYVVPACGQHFGSIILTDCQVLQEDVPQRPRGYTPWTETEEQRLRDGFKRYGRSWDMIQKTCQLRHRTPGQLKDKWRNLEQSHQK
jgi:hypothetical protein